MGPWKCRRIKGASKQQRDFIKAIKRGQSVYPAGWSIQLAGWLAGWLTDWPTDWLIISASLSFLRDLVGIRWVCYCYNQMST